MLVQDSSELPEELRLSSILSSYSARNLSLRLENDYKALFFILKLWTMSVMYMCETNARSLFFKSVLRIPLSTRIPPLFSYRQIPPILIVDPRVPIAGLVSRPWFAPIRPQRQRALPGPHSPIHTWSLAGGQLGFLSTDMIHSIYGYIHIQGVFLTGAPPKSSKYKKVTLG